MRYQSLAAAALTVGPAFARLHARATPRQDQDGHGRGLVGREDSKTWNKTGNIKLTFSEDTVKLGDVKLDDMFAGLHDACHESGLCETGAQTFDGWWQAAGPNGDMGPIVVTMRPGGAYPTWLRNGLVDVLRAAVAAVADCGDSTNTQLCMGGDKGCQPVRTVAHQCEVPAYWGVDYQHPGETNAAPPYVEASVDMELVNSGVCAGIMGSPLDAIAGAVGGVAGGIFTLLEFACS